MSKQIFIIGVGHRARQGKDTIANFMKELKTNVHILHFADALYEEVANKERKYPLITRTRYAHFDDGHNVDFDWIYAILTDAKRGKYLLFKDTEVKILHALFNQRNINTYWGMTEKDAPMLQFWGTEFRRSQNENYWILRVQDKIDKIRLETKALSDNVWIVISDTRFKNEVNFIKSCGGYYIRVVRINKDGSQFIDTSRDPNHPSEIDVINELPFKTITAGSGDLVTLRYQAEILLDKIERM